MINQKRQLSRLAVYVIFRNENNEMLFIRRHNTGWRDGEYTLPAGHVDSGETALAAAVHESYEEVCLKIRENNLELVHVVQFQSAGETDENYINFYFECKKYDVIAKIGEPNKADDLVWIPVDKIHEIPVIDAVADALENICEKQKFSTFGM